MGETNARKPGEASRIQKSGLFVTDPSEKYINSPAFERLS